MNRDKLITYVEAGLSHYKIAEAEGCSPGNVRYWLAKAGLKTRGKSGGQSGLGYTREFLEPLVQSSYSVLEVMRKALVNPSGANHRSWSRLIRDVHKIDTSHFDPHRGQIAAMKKRPRKHWTEILVVRTDRKEESRHLRRAMIESGIAYRCCRCSNDGHWQGEELVLEIDHKNTDSLDNRAENLQFMCSNCHTLKCKKEYELRRKPKPPSKSEIDPNWNSKPKPWLRKVERPSKDVLEKLVWEQPLTQVAQAFGVSDKSIAHWCSQLGISKPPRGHWAKHKHDTKHEDAIRPTPPKVPRVNKLNQQLADEIRLKIKQGRKQRELAREYGCSYGTIWHIKANRIYKKALPEMDSNHHTAVAEYTEVRVPSPTS